MTTKTLRAVPKILLAGLLLTTMFAPAADAHTSPPKAAKSSPAAGLQANSGGIQSYDPIPPGEVNPSAYPPNFSDPTVSPGPGWEWRGTGPPESGLGAWYNEETNESWHPDLEHGEPIGPHWDYTDAAKNKHRWFSDGRFEC